MAKKVETAEIVSPANLWGKPLPRTASKVTATTEGKAARMLPDEDEIDSDVDAELEEDPTDAELLEDDSAEDEDEVVSASGDDDAEEDDDFEAEEGDDADDGEEDDAVDSAVDVDEVPVKARKANTPSKVTKKMSEKKKSISDHVRDEIEARKSAGESLRGVDIVNSLAKRRIKVSPAQVSQLLKKAGVSQKARGGRKAVAVAAGEGKSRSALKTKKVETRQPTPRARGTTSVTTELPWKQLNAAKAFIAACDGSFSEASDALALFGKIESTLHN